MRDRARVSEGAERRHLLHSRRWRQRGVGVDRAAALYRGGHARWWFSNTDDALHTSKRAKGLRDHSWHDDTPGPVDRWPVFLFLVSVAGGWRKALRPPSPPALRSPDVNNPNAPASSVTGGSSGAAGANSRSRSCRRGACGGCRISRAMILGADSDKTGAKHWRWTGLASART